MSVHPAATSEVVHPDPGDLGLRELGLPAVRKLAQVTPVRVQGLVQGFKALQIGFLTKVSFRKYCVALTCGRTLDRVICPYYASGVYKLFGPQVRCRARSEMSPSKRAWMRQATLRTRCSQLRLRTGWP